MYVFMCVQKIKTLMLLNTF